jgi:Ser/Thr protein kinase RdoA (MazF antagonist)
MEQVPFYKIHEFAKVMQLNEEFNTVFQLKNDNKPMFLLRLHQAVTPKKSLRKNLNTVYTSLKF